MNSGKVYLVGAGCGDPDLITVKGLRLIQTADVIVYDRLAPAELLQHAKAEAELVDAGKLPQKHRLDQSEINETLIARAQEGKQVVRLKGGDPFVFGRGGEEAIACFEAQIPFEVIPGITSAIAVPAYAGISVTHRQVATSFTVFTAHESTETSSLDFSALARMGTLVALMGVSKLHEIADRLIAEGLSPDTPACCIEWGTTQNQREVQGTLATIYDLASEANLQPPSITVIGAVVALRQSGLQWFKPTENNIR